jgi:hypothetical protein
VVQINIKEIFITRIVVISQDSIWKLRLEDGQTQAWNHCITVDLFCFDTSASDHHMLTLAHNHHFSLNCFWDYVHHRDRNLIGQISEYVHAVKHYSSMLSDSYCIIRH